MNVYTYSAALFCEDCGRDIREQLTREGKAPANPDDECSYDSDDFPKGPMHDGGGEADSPQHCDSCHEFLDAPLTSEGAEYVREAIAESWGSNPVVDLWADRYARSYDLKWTCAECAGPVERDSSPGVWLHSDTDDKEGADIDRNHVAKPE